LATIAQNHMAAMPPASAAKNHLCGSGESSQLQRFAITPHVKKQTSNGREPNKNGIMTNVERLANSMSTCRECGLSDRACGGTVWLYGWLVQHVATCCNIAQQLDHEAYMISPDLQDPEHRTRVEQGAP
jgi:hypothetical protein